MTLHCYRGLAAAVVIACLSPAPALAQGANARSSGGHATISDTGRAIAPNAAERSDAVSSGFAGTGRALAPGQTDDALANIRAGQETAADREALSSASPAGAPAGPQSIIGADDRVRVNPTTNYPARATTLITFVEGGTARRCTGWLISRDTVATAGHCVHRGSGGASGFFSRGSFRIYPGRNGEFSPYGSCTAGALFTVEGWAFDGDEQFDYGAIKLNCNIGNVTGWYGFFWKDGSLSGFEVIVRGYPGDKPLTQWFSRGEVKATRQRLLFYNADTVRQGGSPVYQNRNQCGPCSMAIHTHDLHGGGLHNTYNHGTRITRQVFRNLTDWIRFR